MLLIYILKLDHMTIGRMRTNQQQDSIFQPFLYVLSIDVIVEHQVGQYLYVVDHFFVV